MQKNLKKRACLPTALSERLIFLIISVSLILFAVFILKIRNRYITKNPEDFIPPSSCDKLMIVAHPDDETFWGGAHLIEDNYLVVCITCGTVKRRVEEFKKAMSITNDKYIMLGYPDLTKGKKDDWSKVHVNIKSDLEKIINYKNWEMIVTHNPYGEYGHIHHIMTNRMVTELSDKDVLYYFGYYLFL